MIALALANQGRWQAGNTGSMARLAGVAGMGRKRNLAALEKALEVEFAKDPVRFFRGIIMPLLPKESKLELDRDGVIRWQSLLGGGVPEVGGE